MATTLNWKDEGENAGDKVLAYVGDATNPAFTVTKSGSVFTLESHITSKENRGGTFETLALAKEYADTVLVEEDIPQNGTQVA